MDFDEIWSESLYSANLSFSDESGSIGYDIGPGNCLIDIAAKELFGLDFDEDGRLAKQGTINDSHLSRLLEGILIVLKSKY